MAITTTTLSKIFKMIAFLLPFKLILLAGSEKIPSYFRFFITDPNDREYWMAGLAAATIVFYICTLILDSISNRLSLKGGAEVLQTANEMAILNDQEKRIQGNYATATQLCANLLFSTTTIIAGTVLIFPLVFTCIGLLVIIQFLFTTWVIQQSHNTSYGALQQFIQNKLSEYLNILSSITFLSAFLIIFSSFINSTGRNTLLGIVTFIAMRQLLSSLVAIIRDAVKLNRNKDQINALVFRESQLKSREAQERQIFRTFFEKKNREQRVLKELNKIEHIYNSVDVSWEEGHVNGVSTFLVAPQRKTGHAEGNYQLQVFSPKELHRLRNEDYLFCHIPRSQLNAPKILTRYTQGPFHCQICEHGVSIPNGDTWADHQREQFIIAWSSLPPPALVHGYTASHPLLHKRLTAKLVARLGVAINSDEEENVLNLFLSELPIITTVLESMPLYVHNLDITNENVTLDKLNSTKLQIWARWSLEPIGAYLPNNVRKKLGEITPRLYQVRKDMPMALTENHFLLTSECRIIEHSIVRGAYRKALSSIAAIIKNPLLQGVSIHDSEEGESYFKTTETDATSPSTVKTNQN
jgi:hypothetical protein